VRVQPGAALAPRASRHASDGDVLTGAHAIWAALRREGVEVVFGYPGGAIMPAYDALLEHPIRHVLVRHEQGAAHMADGYARASGRVGVAIATSGPGATNLVTGIANAMMDSSPIVCITGQVSSHLLGSDAFQETDVVGVTLPITKHSYLVTRASEIAPVLREAFAVARAPRPGPVVVDITKDAQLGLVDAAHRGPEPRRRPPVAGPRDLASAVRLLERATRPVILCGQGVVQARASELLVELAEKLDAPVACTLLGLGGFPASHRLALGMMGMHGEAWVNQAVHEADLLLALGMRFDDRVTGKVSTFAPRARKIHVEIDASEVGKNVPVDVALVGDVGQVLADLIPRVASGDRSAWRARISAGQRAAPADVAEGGALTAAQVIHDLGRLAGSSAIVVTDVGQHQMWEAQHFGHERPRSLITSGGLGAMGFALPAAIGARLARPDDEIWVIAGDGGFQMTACELTTCAQEGLKVIVAIINNGYLGMVRQWQELFHGRRYSATPLLNPDFVMLAQAHGLTGLRVTERHEIPSTVAAARARAGTVVIDFRVAPEENVLPMVPSGASLAEMIPRKSCRP
jgi:acetolactate synthase-1/2/3 large subunit